jgi:Ca-activated chloride channel family protein
VQAGSGRRALVLLSDGVDRYSESRAADVVAHARGTDVMIYPVALGRTGPPLFAELAAVTGGRYFEARDATGLDAAMRAVAADLRHQYLLGYAPSRTAAAEPGAWRSIEVRADVPGARVRARSGYRAD